MLLPWEQTEDKSEFILGQQVERRKSIFDDFDDSVLDLDGDDDDKGDGDDDKPKNSGKPEDKGTPDTKTTPPPRRRRLLAKQSSAPANPSATPDAPLEGETTVTPDGREVYTPTRAEVARGFSSRYPPPESARGKDSGRQTGRPKSAFFARTGGGTPSRVHSARRPRVVDWHSQGEQYESVVADQHKRRIRSQERPDPMQWEPRDTTPFR